jgi:exonuclease SbcD
MSAQEKSLRICHVADVHLGYRRYNKLTKAGLNQREVDVNKSFQEAITRIIALKPDVVVIAGDLFHSVRPSNSVLTFCFRQIRRLAKGVGAPVVITGGNHEAPKRADTGSVLQLLSEIDGVHVADLERKVFRFRERDLSVCCVPHSAIPGLEDDTPRADDRYGFNVLVAHAQINDGWVSDFGGANIDVKDLAPHEWDYIALGHVHRYQAVGLQAVYSGAIEHTASNIWSEANDLKGFVEVALPSGKRTFHALTTPREVLVLDGINAEALDAEELMEQMVRQLDGMAGGIDGKIVRLSIRNVTKEIYKNLDHKLIRSYRSRALNLSLDITFVSLVANTDSLEKPVRGLMRDQLIEFAISRELPGVSKNELKEMLGKYVSKMEEAYEAS